MNLFSALFSSPWRWVAFGLALVLVVAVVVQGLDYGSTWLARRRLTKQVAQTDQQHAARVATEAKAQAATDSSRFTQAGQRQEAARHTQLSQHRYDSLRALFPAAVSQLPASPPRYRPAD